MKADQGFPEVVTMNPADGLNYYTIPSLVGTARDRPEDPGVGGVVTGKSLRMASQCAATRTDGRPAGARLILSSSSGDGARRSLSSADRFCCDMRVARANCDWLKPAACRAARMPILRA